MGNLLNHFKSLERCYIEKKGIFYRISSVFPSIIAFNKESGKSIQIPLEEDVLKKYSFLTPLGYSRRPSQSQPSCTENSKWTIPGQQFDM